MGWHSFSHVHFVRVWEAVHTFNIDSLKGPEHLRRCFHLCSLIRPLPRLELGGAVLEKIQNHQTTFTNQNDKGVSCAAQTGASKLTGAQSVRSHTDERRGLIRHSESKHLCRCITVWRAFKTELHFLKWFKKEKKRKRCALLVWETAQPCHRCAF